MNWTFGKKRPSDKTRDPVVSEFFSSEAIKDAGEALVREAIQNSLDARRDDSEKVSVRVYVSGSDTSLSPASSRKWFTGAWPHYGAPGNGLRPGDVTQTTACRFLLFEDFGTTGLLGDREQYEERSGGDNPFFYFFRAEAKTAKYGDARGRWGIGKQVFPRASRAQTFFGYTETEEGGFLMGGAILKHHWVDDVCYKPDGFWGDTVPVAGDALTVPVTDPAVLSRFREDFNLSRTPGEQGLSVIVPWLDDGDLEGTAAGAFHRSALAFAILDGYFVPILEGRLEATIEDESGSFHLSRNTYRDVLKQLRAGSDSNRHKDIDRLEALLQLAERAHARDYVPFELAPCPVMKAMWTDSMLEETSAARMRDALKEGLTIGVTATLTTRPKDGEPREDTFVCFIEKDDRLSGRACHVREDLIIADVKSTKIPGYACLVRVDRGPLATLLGDSENPAHTEWQASSRNFKDKYVYGGLVIEFVSKFASELLKRVHASSRELDRTLLLDLFSDSGPDPSPERPNRPTQPDDDAPLPPDLPAPPPPRYRIQQIDAGFVVTCAAGRLPAGTDLTVRAAYETSKGNPFKSYNVNDFDFTDSSMAVKVEGAEILICEGNELKVRLSEQDAQVRVTGFDINRDVQVKAAVTAPSAEDADSPS